MYNVRAERELATELTEGLNHVADGTVITTIAGFHLGKEAAVEDVDSYPECAAGNVLNASKVDCAEGSEELRGNRNEGAEGRDSLCKVRDLALVKVGHEVEVED